MAGLAALAAMPPKAGPDEMTRWPVCLVYSLCTLYTDGYGPRFHTF